MIKVDCELARGAFKLNVAFEAGDGLVAIFGPSGAGKSTVLNLIAGIERPDRGSIWLDGEPLVDTSSGIFLPPYRRRVGMVFQSGQLFPHLTVRKNLAYGRRFGGANVPALISFDAVIELLGIGHLLERMPLTLSGGETQRVAIGRALLASPRALLMDEPLASLDEERRSEILPFFERLVREVTLPIVYVSHSAEEVARLATTVCRISAGSVERCGSPEEVLMPLSLMREDRLGGLCLLKGVVTGHDYVHIVTFMSHPAGEFVVPGIVGRAGDSVRVGVRPANVVLATEEPKGLSVRMALRGTLARLETGQGAHALATIELTGGGMLAAYLTRLAADELGLEPGLGVHCLIKSVSVDLEARQ